jgi:ribonuclease H / adenosylcobalamin/alpha-ribazole phosphatase
MVWYDSLILRFDGGCRGGSRRNCGSGWVLMNGTKNEVLAEGYHYIGEGATNNVAEYFALIKGLAFLVDENVGADRIHIQGDSLLVINQMKGEYSVKSPRLTKLHAKATHLTSDVNCEDIRFTHIPRRRNVKADRLAFRAIEEETTSASWIEEDGASDSE